MPAVFHPTSEDVKTYQRLRKVLRTMNDERIVPTIPSRAYDEIGKALGILRDGILHFDSEGVASVLADCCLYDWYHKGKNVIERYAAQHSATARPDERLLLDACCYAGYTVLRVESVLPGRGLYCRDMMANENLFVMDVSASQALEPRVLLATRIIPLDGYWITGGAALPVTSLRVIDELERSAGQPLSLAIVRACLNAGAGERIRYTNPPAPPRRDPAPGDLCPCGSRFKFKFCCGSGR